MKTFAAATFDEQLSYWKKQLADAPVLLELPVDMPRPAIQTGHIASHRFTLGNELGARLRQCSAAHHASLRACLLAGFNALLSRYCGQTDLLVSCPVIPDGTGVQGDGTSRADAVVIRSDLSGNPAFALLIERTQALLDLADEHGDLPFRQLLEALGVERSRSHAPLAQVAFALETATSHSGSVSNFDMSLRFVDDDVLTAELQYSSDLFKPDTVARMAEHLRNILDAASKTPAAHIAALPLLTDAEHRQIVVDWNATAAPCPDACVHELFEEQVAKTPDALAVVFDEQSLSYAELNAKANQLAHYLKAKGVGADVLVGLCARRSLEMVIGLLGILKAGGAYVPLDPAYPVDRLSYMIEDAQPALLLCQESLLGHVQYDGMDTLCLDRDWPSIAQHSRDNPESAATPRTLAYVIYTSGSTGKPKGVALEHKGLCNLCLAQARAFEVDATSQVLQFASISFDAAVSETFVTLTQGACLHLIKQEALRSAYEITKLLEKSAISVVTLPPSLLAVLPQKALPALKTLVLAGEAWSPELARVWAQGRRMLNAYGPTEGTVCATWFEVAATVEHAVPIGRPLSNVSIYILDATLQPVPLGVAGELYIGGIGLARGYLRRPELTAERFVANPFSHDRGARMYRTGDKVRYLEDGNIEFLGRIDHQVKLRGYRIELGEIEATLTAHASVQDAVVMVREDHPGEKRLVAYIVGEQGLNAATLKTHLKATLPDYMLPQLFVFLPALPVSPNGKFDRKSLPAPHNA